MRLTVSVAPSEPLHALQLLTFSLCLTNVKEALIYFFGARIMLMG